MRALDNLQRSCMVRGRARNGFDYVTATTRKQHANNTETTRKRHENDTRQLGGYIVMISERFMRVTDNSKKGSESGIRVRKESVRRTKKATTVYWKNYFLVLFAHVKKKS